MSSLDRKGLSAMQGKEFNEDKKISIYVTIANNLRKKILNRTYKPGDLLPSENELSVYFSASRVTIRKSLSILAIEGLISSCQGRGYTVNKPKSNDYNLKFSISEDEGLKFKFNKVLIEFPNDETRELLGLQDDKLVVFIRRVIYRGTVAIGCDIKYLPYETGMPILEEEIRYADFPEMVEEKISPFELRTQLEIGIEKVDEELAEILSCTTDEYVLAIYKKIESAAGVKIGYGITYLRREYGRLYASSGYYSNEESVADKISF